MALSFTWFGHSAFALNIDGHSILVDPFLSGNPAASADPATLHAEYILLSHAHGDHLGDTVDIAKRTGASVISNFEIANWLSDRGVKTIDMNPGGTFTAEYFSVKLTMAHHSSSFPDGSYGGEPNGFIITAAGQRLYFAGDTCLFLDMQLIGQAGIDVAFLPIGDKYTMGPDDSLLAIDFIRPKTVVPMHYNTFPPIKQDVTAWAERVRQQTKASPLVPEHNRPYQVR